MQNLTCLQNLLRVALAFGFIVVAATSAFADVPTLISYQGRLADTNGNPLDTTVSITFLMYSDSTGGSAFWSETHPAVVTSDGLFSVLLGSFNGILAPAFNGNPRYLAMQVGTGPESTPRMSIVSVGYAFRAVHADTAAYAFASPDATGGWTEIGPIIYPSDANDSVGIGTSTPSAKLDVVGGVVISDKATIGPLNTNTGLNGFVVGRSNIVTQFGGSVSGGEHNTATGEYAHIGGGDNNSATGIGSTIGGGHADTVSNSHATVAGGSGNVASGSGSVVAGGYSNRAASYATTVGGGSSNTAQQFNSTIVGGEGNTTNATYSFIGGGLNHYAYGPNSMIGGGTADTIINTGDHGVIGGGELNKILGSHGVIGGGAHHYLGGPYSAILGGFADTIEASAAYSYLFGIGSRLDDDSTFMVDMPHIVFGGQSDGYEFPDARGSDGQILVADDNGKLNWTDQATGPASPWTSNISNVYLEDTTLTASVGLVDPLANKRFSVKTTGTGSNMALWVQNTTGTAAGFFSGVDGNWSPGNSAAIFAKAEGLKFGGVFSADSGRAISLASYGEYATLYAKNYDSGYSAHFLGGDGVKIDGDLEATGKLKLPAGAANGYVLTSDASGVGYWRAKESSLWTTSGNDVVLSDTSGHVSIGDTTSYTDYARLNVEIEGTHLISAMRVRNKTGTAARFYSGGPGIIWSPFPSAVYGVGEGTSAGGHFLAWEGTGDALIAGTNGSGYAGVFSGGAGVQINGELEVTDTTRLDALKTSGDTKIYGKLTVGTTSYNTGHLATAIGGYMVEASGSNSFAAGYRAKALHSGTFVWSGSYPGGADFVSTKQDQFLIQAYNGVGIGLNSPKGQLDITDNTDGIALHISNADRDIAWQTGQSLQLGDWDGATFNPRMRINNNGNVGVNTTAPNGALHVRGNTDGMALHLSAASGDISWPTNNTLNMGTWDGATFTERVRITSGGNVGIGVSSTPNILTVRQGSATDPVADAWTTYSSRRWKENITPLKGSLDKVKQLRGVSYNWKKDGKSDIGLIAEEVGKIVPEVVSYEANGVDAQSVDYARLVAVLIEAVKEQERTIQQQNKSIEELKSQMTEMQHAMKKSGLNASMANSEL